MHSAAGRIQIAKRTTLSLFPKEPKQQKPNDCVQMQGTQLNTRKVCRSCQKTRPHEHPTNPPTPRSASGASKAAPTTFYADVVKGESMAPRTPNKDKAKEDKEAVKEKAESLQQVLDDVPDDSPFDLWTLPKHGFAEPKRPWQRSRQRKMPLRPWKKPNRRRTKHRKPSKKSGPTWSSQRWPNKSQNQKRCSSSAWRMSTTYAICYATCEPGSTTAARQSVPGTRTV